MRIQIHFYSYFKDVTACSTMTEEFPEGTPVSGLLMRLGERFPLLRQADRSMLIAVGVEYQDRSYVLRDGDEVSLFPPVQGG